MALNIKSAETERKVRILAQRTGETITQAIDRAVDDRLRLVGGTDDADARLARWNATLAKYHPVPGASAGWKEEFYDEFGLPR